MKSDTGRRIRRKIRNLQLQECFPVKSAWCDQWNFYEPSLSSDVRRQAMLFSTGAIHDLKFFQQQGPPIKPVANQTGGNAVMLLERLGKVLRTGEAAFISNIRNGGVAVPEQFAGGLLQTNPLQVISGCFAIAGLKNTMKVKLGKTGQAGQIREIQSFGKMIPKVSGHPV